MILLHSSDLDSRLALRRPQRARRRTLAFPCSRLAAIVGLCTLFGCRAEVVEERPSHTVEIGPIERIVIATGTIEPATEVEIRPRIPGIIEQIHVEEGDVVEVGQALIEIERELLASQVREAEAHLTGGVHCTDDLAQD